MSLASADPLIFINALGAIPREKAAWPEESENCPKAMSDAELPQAKREVMRVPDHRESAPPHRADGES